MVIDTKLLDTLYPRNSIVHFHVLNNDKEELKNYLIAEKMDIEQDLENHNIDTHKMYLNMRKAVLEDLINNIK